MKKPTWMVVTSDGMIRTGTCIEEMMEIMDQYGPEVVDYWHEDQEEHVKLGTEEGGE